MARFYENNRNTPPRPPRPTPPGDVARRPQTTRRAGGSQDSGQGSVSKEESKKRLRDAQRLMPRPQPRQFMPMPPGLEGQQYLAPGGMGGRMPGPSRENIRDALENIVPFLEMPGRIVSGAVEGGIRAVNPDFEMPFLRGSGQMIPMPFIPGSGQDQPMPMPLPRNFDPMTDALLRAYMRQMQGGE